jgi:hypothetical protein
VTDAAGAFCMRMSMPIWHEILRNGCGFNRLEQTRPFWHGAKMDSAWRFTSRARREQRGARNLEAGQESKPASPAQQPAKRHPGPGPWAPTELCLFCLVPGSAVFHGGVCRVTLGKMLSNASSEPPPWKAALPFRSWRARQGWAFASLSSHPFIARRGSS